MRKRSWPDPRRAKVHFCYSVAETAKLYGIHRNTVRAWLKAGLECFVQGGKVFMLGSAIRAFLERRRAVRRTPLKPGWLYCMKCREARLPAGGMAELVRPRGGTATVRALCHCGALMNRRVSLAKLDAADFAQSSPEPDESELFTDILLEG